VESIAGRDDNDGGKRASRPGGAGLNVQTGVFHLRSLIL
jgi:hypothetical protein